MVRTMIIFLIWVTGIICVGMWALIWAGEIWRHMCEDDNWVGYLGYTIAIGYLIIFAFRRFT